mmetsp:Transcript_38347/g.108395  ORF Transcript_38347/g.108395 Transcript_38347/m.108395 type:complete len:225 (+) Transcript_38347:76-750(+)
MVTPAKATGTSRSPGSRLELLSGYVASALTPSCMRLMSSLSRMQPLTMTPDHPFCTPIIASWSPSRAQRMEAPPSTTSTRASPGSPSAFLTSGLFSKHRTVEALPLNRSNPPRSLKIGSAICTFRSTVRSTGSGTCTSHRSAVAAREASGGGWTGTVATPRRMALLLLTCCCTSRLPAELQEAAGRTSAAARAARECSIMRANAILGIYWVWMSARGQDPGARD